MKDLIYLLVTWLPVASILASIVLLLAGLFLHKSHRRPARICYCLSGVCVTACILLYGSFFLAGFLGLGPVPN